jgi:iron complex outermembrane receptor protein
MVSRIVLNSLASTAVLSWSTVALAQAETTPKPPEQQQATSNQLGDIVVTAQRRAQPLQNVPIAVVALSATALASKGVTSTEDLATAVPGLTFTHQLITAAPAVRGISQANGAPGDEPPTAIYVDGVYLAIAQAAFFSFNNIEQIEVLKGPQGTLFGRNAAAGVINITTKTPSYKPLLDASVSYASFNTVEAKAYASTGITDKLAGDIAVYWRDQQDGWGHNLFNGKDVFKGKELSLRSKFLWQIAPATTLTVAADYGHSKTDIGIAQHIVAGAVGAGGATFPGFYNVNSNIDSGITYHQWGASANLEHDGEWAKFKSITSYRSFESQTTLDGDATAQPLQRFLFREPAKTFTQEFQLVSPHTSSVDWIVGAFYLWSKAGQDVAKVNTSIAIRGVQTTKSISGFGQVTVPLSDRTHLTGGLRYTHDSQQINGGFYTVADSSFQNTGVLLPPGPIQQKADFGKLTFRLAIDHHITNAILAYASLARGFKSGLFNTISPADPAVKPQTNDQAEIGLKTTLFDKRVRINSSIFAANIKGVQLQASNAAGLFSLLNAAKEKTYGFDTDIAIKAANNLTITGGVAYTHARYNSFPGAPLFAPNPQLGCPGQLTGNCSLKTDASGNPAILTPEWAGNIGLEYLIPSSLGDFTVSGNYAYTGKIFWLPDDRLSQPGYSMATAALMWRDVTRRYSARLWVNNLLDAKYYIYENEKVAGDVGSPGAPRTVGVTLALSLR